MMPDRGVESRRLVTVAEPRFPSTGPSRHRHGGHSSPIEKLSFEVLSQIFLECLPETGFPKASTKVAPTLLARVCSHWRAVAMRTPLLWAGINLGDNWRDLLNPRHDYLKDAMAAKEWSIRAGSCLLSYRLYYWNCPPRSQNVLKVILSHHGRWRHIAIHLPAPVWTQFLSAAVRTVAPHLQYLELLGAESSSRSEVVQVPNPGFPKLHSLFLGRCGVLFDFADTGAPFLRNVTVDNCPELTLDDCWCFLHHCPNLEIFAAYCDSRKPLTSTSATTRRTIHETRCLKKLHLDVQYADSGQLLGLFYAPALESLQLADFHTGGGPGATSGYPQLAPFLSKSSAHLTSMNIDLDMTDDEFLASFRRTPALTSVELHSQRGFLSDAVMDSLIMRAKDPQKHILPSLEHIILTGVDESRYESIEKIVLSRWEGRAGTGLSTTIGEEMSGGWERRLNSVHLYGPDLGRPSNIALRPMIKACIEGGLEVIDAPLVLGEFYPSVFNGSF
ncbi:hypothetical protein BD410DRAFT_896178 [Rickenella mellea]|uniref:Uncharacterized protein n=1 Tax=Rickenella mellea TaxID=50990 RepID=A0A4Y7QCE3_9AGAM|nr:hypothetical protein BD410DRAFT_896178 [Rickenella mellea]